MAYAVSHEMSSNNPAMGKQATDRKVKLKALKQKLIILETIQNFKALPAVGCTIEMSIMLM